MTPPVTLAGYQCLQPRQVDEAASRKAAHQLKIIAQRVTNASKMEYNNKRECRMFERKVQSEQADESALTTPLQKQTFGINSRTSVTVGEFVVVTPDLSPGKKSFGGQGWVTAVNKIGQETSFEIKNIESELQNTESHVALSRVTVATPPQQVAQLTNYRKDLRKQPKLLPSTSPIPTERSDETILTDKLIHAHRYHKSKGWHCAELGYVGKTNKDPGFTQALASDYRELKSYCTALRRNKIKLSKGLTVQNLAFAWGLCRDAPSEAHKTIQAGLNKHHCSNICKYGVANPPNNKIQSIIECRESAKGFYTPF